MFPMTNIFTGICICSLWLCFVLVENCGCGHYDVTFKYFKNCAEPLNQAIEIHNLTINIRDCKFIPRGCFTVKRAIPPGKIVYSLSKPPFKTTGTDDICQYLKDEDIQKKLESYDESLPRKCIIQEGDYCITMGNTTIEQISEQTLSRLEGESTGYFKMDDACIEFKIEIKKNFENHENDDNHEHDVFRVYS